MGRRLLMVALFPDNCVVSDESRMFSRAMKVGCLTFILLLRKSLLAPSKNQEIKDGSDSPVPLQRRCGRLLSASDKRLLCVGDGSFTGGEAIAGVEVWNRSWRKALFGIEAGSDEGTLLSRKGVGDRNASPYVFRP
ncbi:unnamed protein product [Lactuca virosa]|uniref:Uncharacterized protein n=1 Tax=Lactuca virosa TaxID=75947 RepID=A0AAU9M9Q0_9ASTR|nr:unnamed protein product [Lactuca virosa]